jgi:D-alanyl-D-alanine endopeptidase (penicillin-binding protein 7)
MKVVLFILSLFICNASATEAFAIYDMDSHSIIDSKNSDNTQSIASLSKLVTAMVCIDSGSCNQTLLKRLLVRSDNHAAEKIAETYIGGRTKFLQDMNHKVELIGLHETKFIDPSGLSVFNRSTAREYVEVVMEAEKYPLIKQISSSAVLKDKRESLRNTNSYLLNMYNNIVLSKTGYTSKAGHCLALVVETSTKKFIIVILGEGSSERRIQKAKRLISML